MSYWPISFFFFFRQWFPWKFFFLFEIIVKTTPSSGKNTRFSDGFKFYNHYSKLSVFFWVVFTNICWLTWFSMIQFIYVLGSANFAKFLVKFFRRSDGGTAFFFEGGGGISLDNYGKGLLCLYLSISFVFFFLEKIQISIMHINH